jgi:nucleoside-diphosphate-sugar epimerase
MVFFMILLTGASGFIGSAILNKLVGGQFKILSRKNIPHFENYIFYGDIDGHSNYQCAIDGVSVVIHTAACAHRKDFSAEDYFDVNTLGTLNLARQAADAGVKRFIFISSIGVNGRSNNGAPFRYDDAPQPCDEYADSKLKAETGLLEIAKKSRMEVVIIRPPLVYGAGAPGNFGKLINAINKGCWLPLGKINNKRSFIAIDNLVDFVITCVEQPQAANKIFLVSDDRDISTTELLKMMEKYSGKKSSKLLPLPISLLRFAGWMTRKDTAIKSLCDDLQVDITYSKDTLHWQPLISVEEGIRRCFMRG